jgi:hypothetical protein
MKDMKVESWIVAEAYVTLNVYHFKWTLMKHLHQQGEKMTYLQTEIITY